jgi:hypothetical protein
LIGEHFLVRLNLLILHKPAALQDIQNQKYLSAGQNKGSL